MLDQSDKIIKNQPKYLATFAKCQMYTIDYYTDTYNILLPITEIRRDIIKRRLRNPKYINYNCYYKGYILNTFTKFGGSSQIIFSIMNNLVTFANFCQ